MPNNKDLFINGYLDRIAARFPQSENPATNRNLAFEIFSIAALLDKPFEEVYDNILVKGSHDGGIDGIWFQDLGEYFLMHVFQCKNSGGLSTNQINKFRGDFRDIFTDANRVGRLDIGDLQPWIDNYRQLSESGVSIDTRLYFVFNGQKADPAYAHNQAIYDAYQDPDTGFLIVDSDDLYQKIGSLARTKRNAVRFTFHPERSNISALDSQGLYTYAIQDIRAANCRIPARELCELMELERTTNGTIDTLFEENIRAYLGVKVRPNKRMNETINRREDAVYFPFLNNGITIICEQLSVPKAPQNDTYLLPVVNPQIVNGLQTSWVLYTNYRRDPALLKDVFVNVRVYETRDQTLIEKITDATNTQTPINYRDKISNKDFNSMAKAVFRNAGINYITKRGEPFSRGNDGYQASVESETVLKFWYATFFEEPYTAKNSIASVLQKIFDASTTDQHPMEGLFAGGNDSPIYRQLLTAYRIYRKVQAEKQARNGQYEFLPYADELMSYGVYKAVGTTLDAYQDDARLTEGYEHALSVVADIVENAKRDYEEAGRTFSFNGYFKIPECRVHFNEHERIVPSATLVEDLKRVS